MVIQYNYVNYTYSYYRTSVLRFTGLTIIGYQHINVDTCGYIWQSCAIMTYLSVCETDL